MHKGQIAADILEQAGSLFLILDTQGRILDFNRKITQILGRTREDLLGQKWCQSFVAPDFRESVSKILHEMAVGKRGPDSHLEYPILTKAGTQRTISWCHNTRRDSSGETSGIIGCGQDVTERVQQEGELRRREAQWHAILEATVDGIITVNAQGEILNFNRSASRIFGYSPEEIVGRNVSQLMPEPDSSNHNDYIRNYLQSGEAKIIGIGREVYGRKKNGELFPMYLAVGEVSLPGERLFSGIVRDLTSYHKMQEQLVRNENLAALGEMAATVAHEVKNPLASISGAIQVLQDTLDTKDPRRSVMGEILGQVERLDNTVRQLLVLSKPWKPDLQICDLRFLLRQMTKPFFEAERSGSIRFLEQGLETLEAPVDPALLEKVIINLIQNSLEAMPEGGTVSIGLAQDSKGAVITLADDGPGLPAEIRDRIFDPFVTSKLDGTGLGLPICRKIMEAHGGSIEVVESSDLGTIIELRLPLDRK